MRTPRRSSILWLLSATLTGVNIASCGQNDSKASDPYGRLTTGPGSANQTPIVVVQNPTCEDAKLIGDALTALETNCFSCHGKDGQTKGGPKDVSDLAALVQTGKIVPRDIVGSPLLAAIQAGKMPPAGKARPTQDSIDALDTWVAAGAPVLATREDLTRLQTTCAAGGTATPSATPTASATPDPSSSGPGGSTGTGTNPLPLNAIDILKKYCAGCHGPGKNLGGLTNIADLQHLIDTAMIVPGDLSKSKIYTRITDPAAPMPPAGKPGPSQAEIQIIANWILGGAPVNNGNPTTTRAVLSPDDVFNKVLNDLQQLATQNNELAQNTRYVSFAHLANSSIPDSLLQDYTNGFGRVVNSLSLNRVIRKPVAIDAGKTIFRIDVRDYLWNQQDWENILRFFPYRDLQLSSSRRRQFREIANTDLPVVNGDWFSFQVTQAPLYDSLLRLPNNEAGLERILGFSIADNFKKTLELAASPDTEVLRAGFKKSGVALNNRAFDRHPVPLNDGGYWRSYDFKDPGLNGNLQTVKSPFTAPLGPANQIRFGNRNLTDIQFQEDAGEIIFTLPNGLQGYFLVDANGRHLDAAALDIALDKNREKKVIINGYSCMGCHSTGLLKKNDEVGPAVQLGSGFNAEALAFITRLYGKQQKMDDAMTSDTNRYMTALQQASINPNRVTSLTLAGNDYELEVNVAGAALVLGLTPQQFTNFLNNASPDLKAALAGLLSPNGTIERQTFEAQFPKIIQQFFVPTP